MAIRDDDAYFGADQRVDDAMAMLEDERRKIGDSMRSRNEERTTVQARDHSFTMTFDGRGDLVDMAFQGTKFRSLAPKELASLIIATLQKGRLEAIEKMAAELRTPGLEGVDLVGIATGKADPDKVVDALIAPFLRGMPGQDRLPGGSRG